MAVDSTVEGDIKAIGQALAEGADGFAMAEKLMEFACRWSDADGCFLFVLDGEQALHLDYAFNKSIDLRLRRDEAAALFSEEALAQIKDKAEKGSSLALFERCIAEGKAAASANVYMETGADNTLFDDFDAAYGYRTVSALCLPLLSGKGEVLGAALFANARDRAGKAAAFSETGQAAASFIAFALGEMFENRRLRGAYIGLLESFIKVLAEAIDEKSPYTGAHCQRVPVLAKLLATAAIGQKDGPLAGFDMSEDDLYSMHIASWLHDCGKIATPEYIVDKATKLETVDNRIHEIRNRFEILRRDAHIDYLKKRLANAGTQEELQAEFLAKAAKLEDDFAFVAKCNIGDDRLSRDDIKRLEEIAQVKFARYFSRLAGLSWAERDRIADRELYAQPAQENLLQNREDHLFANNNLGELYNLEIRQGTINREERAKINEHAAVGIRMLKALPFPKELAKVVEYAGAHHERVDGKGYPNHLTGAQMSVPAKIMAIADIFEALTAADRPYKEPKKLSEVLGIMKKMRDGGHIDPGLYQVFIDSGVWKDYAEQYVSPEQADEVNPEDYL